MEIFISSLLIILTLYLFWLFIFVFRFNWEEFFYWKPKNDGDKSDLSVSSQNVPLIGKTQLTFIEEIPELELVKPVLEEPLPLKQEEDNEIAEEELQENYLSEEEKREILENEYEDSYWNDDSPEDDFHERNSIDDIYHAADVIAGNKTSESDFAAAKETLHAIPGDLVELLARHAVNEKKVKALFENYLNNEINQNSPVRLKDFIVKDYIA